MNTLQSSFLIEVHQQDDKYSFTISNGVIDKTPLVISSYCFDRESECFNYIYSKVDLFLLDSSTTHLLTIIDRQYGGELCRYYLNHKRDSIKWDGIVRKVGDDAFAQCREDFIYGHSHLEPLLPVNTSPSLVKSIEQLWLVSASDGTPLATVLATSPSKAQELIEHRLIHNLVITPLPNNYYIW